ARGADRGARRDRRGRRAVRGRGVVPVWRVRPWGAAGGAAGRLQAGLHRRRRADPARRVAPAAAHDHERRDRGVARAPCAGRTRGQADGELRAQAMALSEKTVLVGFAEAMAGIETTWSLQEAGFRVVAF